MQGKAARAACHRRRNRGKVPVWEQLAVTEAVEDSAATGGTTRYLARRAGAPAGAASLRLQGGVGILSGSATLPPHQRRGVQSQSNMMKAGFALAYARAVMVLAA